MADKFMKNTLKIVVAQMCQTIGWSHITAPAMEVMIDVVHRTLMELAKTTHSFADEFGRTRPNLNDLGLAFRELGIEVRELREYVEYVDPVPCNVEVPLFPVAKDSHLNFLKPGSQEVVTRPVHVHEHLPPTLELSIDTNLDLGSSPQPSPTFKRPGDPIDVAAKRMRLGLEEEGRALREISSVIMTTGGFISPAREGKLPEPKLALPVDVRSSSPPAQHYPSVPPEVNREKKKKVPKPKESTKEKEKHVKKEKKQPPPADHHFVQKLVNMKETAKLKALKAKPRAATPEKSLIQKLAESPHLVVTPILPDPPQPVAKLATEPDKQKLNIFKKISKIKEEELPPQPPPPPPPPVAMKEESVFSSPGSPSTPKTPDIMRPKSPEHKKKKKDKDKGKRKERRKEKEERAKIVDVEIEKRPATPELSISHVPPPPFPFFPPGLIPPAAINNPLIPRFPMPMGPNFPNLPIPPPHFMHPPVPHAHAHAPVKHDPPETPLPTATKSPLALLLDKKKGKEHHKKDKKGKKEKKQERESKKKDKKDKPKKDKKEKRKKEKEQEREKEKDREKVKEVAETSVPKLTIKVAAVEEKPPSKPAPEKRGDSPEVAKLSALFSKPGTAKQPPPAEQKPLHVHTDNLKTPKETPLQKSPGTIIDKDGNKVWICPSCGRPDDGTPMIGCDECDAWYHWVCVGIQVPPDENVDWYCRFCIVKKQGSHEKKKRGRKKKPPT